MSMFQIFDDKLAMNKIQHQEKMFAELITPKHESDIKKELIKEMSRK